MIILDYFGVFNWISGKRDEINKSGKFQGPTPRRKNPTQQRKDPTQQHRSTPRHGMFTSRHG